MEFVKPSQAKLMRDSVIHYNLINGKIYKKLSIDSKASIKQQHNFIVFDNKDFYAAISKELLTDASTFAKTIIKLDDHDKGIINHSRKSLLFNQEQTWMKKGGDLFDVSMVQRCVYL